VSSDLGNRWLIDSHQHVFWHGRDDRGLVLDMDEHGIDQAWLLTWEESYEEMGGNYAPLLDPRFTAKGTGSAIPFELIIEAYRRYPDRFVPGYCPHPADVHAVGKLQAAARIHGVKVCGEWKFSMPFDDPRCIEIFRAAGDLGLPVVLHLDVPYLPPAGGAYVGHGRWKGGTIDNLERALIQCPHTTFIGHAPGFWREMAGNADQIKDVYLSPPLAPGGRLPRLFDMYPNLCADLSAGSALRAMQADPGEARKLLLRHPDRFLFGRDYYGGELLAFLSKLDLPKDVWRKIGRENAQRLIGIT